MAILPLLAPKQLAACPETDAVTDEISGDKAVRGPADFRAGTDVYNLQSDADVSPEANSAINPIAKPMVAGEKFRNVFIIEFYLPDKLQGCFMQDFTEPGLFR